MSYIKYIIFLMYKNFKFCYIIQFSRIKTCILSSWYLKGNDRYHLSFFFTIIRLFATYLNNKHSLLLVPSKNLCNLWPYRIEINILCWIIFSRVYIHWNDYLGLLLIIHFVEIFYKLMRRVIKYFKRRFRISSNNGKSFF